MNRISGAFADFRRSSSRPSSLEPAVPPAVRTYLLAGDHGTFRRYLLEVCMVLGLFLPWIGPLLGLCAVVPMVELVVWETTVVTPASNCYNATPMVCNDEVFFDYYFWNITNANEVRPVKHYEVRSSNTQLCSGILHEGPFSLPEAVVLNLLSPDSQWPLPPE